MATELTDAVALRASAIARGAAQWRDRSSAVRAQAREALVGGLWPAEIVEVALDNALWDLDAARALELCSVSNSIPRSVSNEVRMDRANAVRGRQNVLAVLPGNVIGPVIQSAYCAAVAGTHAILKVSCAERYLAGIVSRQFDDLGEPLKGVVEAAYWRGGDTGTEAETLLRIWRVIVFGEDETIRQIRQRAEPHVDVVGYGESYSVAFVHVEASLDVAAAAIARDVCLFDQRGCMSPQTVYVQGDRGRAVLFAHALARSLETTGKAWPRAEFELGEAASVSSFVRRLAATALEPTPHGLDTLLRGPSRAGVPEFVVAVEPFGQPTCAGFARIVSVKPCLSARDVTTQLKYYGREVETIGLAVGTPDPDAKALRASGALRMCAVGEMQRPLFGYRPTLANFSDGRINSTAPISSESGRMNSTAPA